MCFHPSVFTGKERDEETGYSYFSARYLDHDILTSFLSVDRYADKYPFISPYAYCAWNPIRLTDPSGDSIVYSGTPEQIEILKEYVNQFAAKCPNQYKLLKESSNVYNVQYVLDDDDGSGGSFSFASEGRFNVNIKENREGLSSNRYSDIEVLAHELKHAEQYEKCQIGFKRIKATGKVLPYAYDIDDEIEAALQANLFDGNSTNTYADIKKVKSYTKSKYNNLSRKKVNVFQQHRLEVTNNGKVQNDMTIEERNARPNAPMTIIYNKKSVR